MSLFADTQRPLQIVTTCRAYDLPVLELAFPRLQANLPFKNLSVIAPNVDCKIIRRRLGRQVQVIPEDEFIPGMNLRELRRLARFGFPKMAGWYFQQFLKLQYAFVDPADDFYLIWDADTVPLRPMRFFDSAGRMLLTKASEYHVPYFETYRRLFHAEPNRDFSFIAQHMLVQKSLAREMLGVIEQRAGEKAPWAWRIMNALPSIEAHHLFSEFETYGHYLKNYHPGRVAFVERPWWRFGSTLTGGKVPTHCDLEKLVGDYEFVSFEKATRGWRYLVKCALNKNPK